jgi:hypothetical protein
MIKTTKNVLEEQMSEAIEEMYPDFTPHQTRKISVKLSEIAKNMIFESNAEILESLTEANLKLEQHRNLFRSNIDSIQNQSKIVLAKLEADGLVSYKKNSKNGKTELVGRSSVIVQMVFFINKLNDMIIHFFEEVYKIQPDKSTNTSLFN